MKKCAALWTFMRRILHQPKPEVALECKPPADLNVAWWITLRGHDAECTDAIRGQAYTRPKIGSVQGVDSLDTDLELHTFTDPEVLRNPKIELEEAVIPKAVDCEWNGSKNIRTGCRIRLEIIVECRHVSCRYDAADIKPLNVPSWNVDAISLALLVRFSDQ